MKQLEQVDYPAHSAFVIQFACPHTGSAPRPGRIEHVVSGRARRFEDGSQILAFVAEVLGALDDDHTAQPGERRS